MHQQSAQPNITFCNAELVPYLVQMMRERLRVFFDQY